MIRMEMKTEILPASDEKSIEKAAALLQNGELVALPTETVYGIAADARNGEAVKKIFVAKGRPQDNPLIVHVTGPEMLPGLVSEVPERAQLLMAAFCPGPLTIIMPRGPEVAAECCAGLDTVGDRFEVLREELNALPQIDYERVNNAKLKYLRLLFEQEGKKVLASKEFKAFFADCERWLAPYAHYCYLRDFYGTCVFSEWPDHKQWNEADRKSVV